MSVLIVFAPLNGGDTEFLQPGIEGLKLFLAEFFAPGVGGEVDAEVEVARPGGADFSGEVHRERADNGVAGLYVGGVEVGAVAVDG